jgi:hypothetical protein
MVGQIDFRHIDDRIVAQHTQRLDRRRGVLVLRRLDDRNPDRASNARRPLLHSVVQIHQVGRHMHQHCYCECRQGWDRDENAQLALDWEVGKPTEQSPSPFNAADE